MRQSGRWSSLFNEQERAGVLRSLIAAVATRETGLFN